MNKSEGLINYLRHGPRMFYMPIISAFTGIIYGYEALARDLHEDKFPYYFFDEAKSHGSQTLAELEMMCIQAAIQEAAQCDWLTGRKLFVNVSGGTFAWAPFSDYFLGSDLPLPPWRVVFEILEGISTQESRELRKRTSALFRVGHDFAIDDQGTQGTCLEHLLWLNARYVKIDQRYANGCLIQNRFAVLGGCLEDAEGVNGRGIIEGVEEDWSARELARFIEYRASFLQGFLFGRPLPADKISGEVLPAGMRLLQAAREKTAAAASR